MSINLENLQLEELSATVKRSGGFFAGITKNGTISIYRGFYDDENIKESEYVLIMSDKANNVIALKFYKEKPEGKNVLKLNKSKNNKSNAWIYAGPLLKAYKFNFDDFGGKYIPIAHEHASRGKLYLLNLNEKITKKVNKTE